MNNSLSFPMARPSIQRNIRRLLGLALLLAAAGCAVTPPYHKPTLDVPAHFKEAPPVAAGWKVGQPSEAAYRGAWWKVFGDGALNALETQAQQANPGLKVAAARLAEARAQQRAARSAWFPEIDAGFGPTRQRVSPASQQLPQDAASPPYTLWRAQVNVSYEADLFGRVSAMADAARADAQQSEALFRSVQLALQADVAQNYFAIRELDAEQALYAQTVTLREQALQLVERRFAEGDISELDVARARSELESARAQAYGVTRQRTLAEHGLAILLGKPPADFSLPAQPLEPVVVRIPPGLPSSLLERRPDIAAAERAMAAANARVGVAKAAFFPQLDITGGLGYESARLGDLLTWSSRTFLLGPLVGTMLTLPIFDGGRREAGLQQARARYEADVAQYRETVLTAFRETEDSLASLRILDDQVHAQQAAVAAAARAAQLSRTQYQEGSTSYLDVIDAERTVLQSKREAVQLQGAQAASTVALIRALGGGWDAPTAGMTPTEAHVSEPSHTAVARSD